MVIEIEVEISEMVTIGLTAMDLMLMLEIIEMLVVVMILEILVEIFNSVLHIEKMVIYLIF